MAGLLDFLQAASNTAASNVSGPVDGLAWLLRKAGVPVNNPMLGSAWMEQQGLTKPVKQSPASLAGETMALTAPIAMAAKAPQIAAGLLTAQDKAAQGAMAVGRQGADMAGDYMARSGLAPQAIAWHGSPHKFDKFSAKKINTGEGSQVEGYGLYLADSPEVARHYAQMNINAATKPTYQYTDPLERAAATVERAGGDVKFAIERLSIEAERGDAIAAQAVKALQSGAKLPMPGVSNLYKVDLPDETIAKMLDWDKPLSQQPANVQQAMKDFGIYEQAERTGYIGRGLYDAVAGKKLHSYKDPVKNAKAAKKLQAAGIPGVRYLDGVSRTAGQGTSNYVVFPGEEGLLKILERNGQALP